MNRKPFEELNLIDNFLFGAALDHEVHGPLIAKIILETVLQREVKIKQINPEKPLFPLRPDLHGVRLDAYIEEDAADVRPGDIFDLEPDKKANEKDELPKRSRYYHSRIDSHILSASRKYTVLPNTWVIFITPYDPFGEDLMVYTIRNHCVELPEMEYDDGAATLFLYVHGKKGKASKELRELLRYFSDTTRENACNEKLTALQSCIDDIKTNPRIKEEYMDLAEFIQYEREEAAAKAAAERDAAFAVRDAAVADRDAAVAERDTALLKVKELEAKLLRLQTESDNLNQKE